MESFCKYWNLSGIGGGGGICVNIFAICLRVTIFEKPKHRSDSTQGIDYIANDLNLRVSRTEIENQNFNHSSQLCITDSLSHVETNKLNCC